jgi:hypothetical protein
LLKEFCSIVMKNHKFIIKIRVGEVIIYIYILYIYNIYIYFLYLIFIIINILFIHIYN